MQLLLRTRGCHRVFVVVLLILFVLPAHAFASQEYKAWRAEVRPGVKGGEDLTRVTLDTFVPIWAQDDRLLFLNPRVQLTDAHENEGNLGLGYRQLVAEGALILGGNIYYDERESHFGNPFHQLAWGLEALSAWVDVRLNAYHPLSSAKRVEALDTGSFTETALLRFNGYEEPLPGVDYEAAVLVPYLSRFVETRVALGGFFYNAEHGKNVDGHRVRFEARPNHRLTVELEFKDIHGGGTDTFIGGYVSVPFDMGAACRGKNPFAGWREALQLGQGARPLRARMTDAVIRDIDITSQAKPDTLHPDTVSDVVFVDNSNTGAATGTNSQPYTTLASAVADSRAAGNRIFVRKGSGTYTNTSVTLPSNTILWGAGYQELNLGGTSAPVLDGNGSNVITLGTSNTVQGLTIQNGAHGIAGTNPSALTIRNNTLSSNATDGVNVTTSGSGTHTMTLSSNTMASNGNNGIKIVPGGSSTATVTISSNTLTNNTTNNAEVSAGSTATATVTYTGNTSTGATTGLVVSPTDTSTTTVTFTNNTVSSATNGFGAAQSGGSTVTMTASNNTVTTPASGLGIGATSLGTGSITATMSGNTVTNSASATGIRLRTLNSGSVTGTVSNNTVSAGAVGVELLQQDTFGAGGTIAGTVTGNTITAATTAGIQTTIATGTITLNASSNTVTSNVRGFNLISATTVDLGGGALGSAGRNRLFSNTTADFTNNIGATVKAENNWFGSASATPTVTGADAVDTTPQLTTDPGS